MRSNRWLIAATAVCALLALSAQPANAQSCKRPVDRPFKVFNALFYKGIPDLAGYGLKPIHVMSLNIWAPNAARSGPPDPALVRAYVDNLPKDGAPIVLDYEEYVMIDSAARARAGVASLSGIMAAFRKAAPDRMLGYYGYLPLGDYWRAVEKRNSAKFLSLQRDNNRVAPLAKGVDALFPSLYTFYPDQDGWVKRSTALICEARRLSTKPVYVFLWPDYHGNGRYVNTRNIPADYWRLQLETARAQADGIVIWGGWDFEANGKQSWNPDAPWWNETKKFMRSLERK